MTNRTINHNEIVVLGAGESGVGAALLAKKQGWKVFVSDKGKIKEAYKKVLREEAIEYEEEFHTKERILSANKIIKSPGIPDKAPLIKELHEKGIPVLSEIEFASWYTNAKIISITGSNGKTTTTNLVYHLLKTANFNVGIGGNIGYSFAKQVADTDRDYYVLELSSFQLDGMQSFNSDIAILLNITADHLDRYDYDVNKYIASKFRIIENQTAKDCLIYNGKDENITQYLKEHPRPIACNDIILTNTHFKNKVLICGNSHFETSKLSIKGIHNMFNAACAIHVAKRLGVKDEIIQKGLNTFKNAPHRLEHIATINDIKYINDSKATNVDAVYYALQAMETPTVWIVGGVDKGNDYSVLEDFVSEKVKAVICLGKDNEKLLEAFSTQVKIIEETQDIKEAISLATSYATAGDTVLLSPACASFDLFKNYIDRGEQFTKAVKSLETVQG